MKQPTLLAHTQTRELFGHHMLLHASELQLEAAEASEVGRFNHCLAAVVMTSLAVEALLNAVGSRVANDWAVFERSNPIEKLSELRTVLQFPYDPSGSTWSTLQELVGLRNDLAHVKPQRFQQTNTYPEHVANKFLSRRPLSTLERQITVGNAQRFINAVQELKGILTNHLDPDLRFGIYVDAWSGSITVADHD